LLDGPILAVARPRPWELAGVDNDRSQRDSN
jgi:hypothetical protein